MRIALCTLILLLLMAPGHALAQEPTLPEPPPVRDGRFGAVAAYDGPEIATAAGVGWTRALFWWHQVERDGPGQWNPHAFPDGWIAREQADGREVIGLLAGTPVWASASGSPRAVPDGLFLPYDDPNNHWGRFVFMMAQRYAGQVDRWVIWNEPDVWDDSHPGKTWNGTVEEYVQLLKVAYQAAHAANPNVKIHLTATTYWWDAEYGRELYLDRLLRAIRAEPDAAAMGGFFDVATLHLYFQPEQLYSVTRQMRQLLDANGFASKPFWINETNAPPSDDPQHPAPSLRFRVTLEEQAAFTVQGWAMGLAAGAERIAFYKTKDEAWLPPMVEPYGLARADDSLRPVFWAYRTIVGYLGGYQSAQLLREGAVRRVTVERGAQGRTTVIWTMGTAPQRVRVPAQQAQALLVDAYGPVRELAAANGVYDLVVAPSRDGRIGGPPFLIVEGSGAALRLPRPANLPPAEPLPIPPPPGMADWAIPGGRFFTQAASGQGGFSVVDDGEARFWSEFQRLGGTQTVGYPISRRFVYDGFVTQAFQKLVLQWRPEVGQAWPVNLLDELSRHGHDQRLLATRQTPLPAADLDPPGASWPQIVAGRQALLDANPAIRARYFAARDPMTLFGLPVSRVEDVGNHYAIRTQRAVFQQWKERVPWAEPGQVTIANGGDIAKELGWLSGAALHPEPIP